MARGGSESPWPMVSVSDAQQIVMETLQQYKELRRIVHKAPALHDVLAEDILAPWNFPSFPASIMDGFAVRSRDVQTAPVVLDVLGESTAGCPSSRTPALNQAVYVTTGAQIPEGADAVVKVEWTRLVDDGTRVEILHPVEAGKWIRQPGSDIAEGDIVCSKPWSHLT